MKDTDSFIMQTEKFEDVTLSCRWLVFLESLPVNTFI